MNASDLKPGDIVWVEMGNTVGHEQAHTRPWLILSSHKRLHLVRGLELVIGVPLTSKQHHGAAFASARILIPSSEITSIDPRFEPPTLLRSPNTFVRSPPSASRVVPGESHRVRSIICVPPSRTSWISAPDGSAGTIFFALFSQGALPGALQGVRTPRLATLVPHLVGILRRKSPPLGLPVLVMKKLKLGSLAESPQPPNTVGSTRSRKVRM